jgi:membrane peptidoglycan carboxypeptidase
MSEQRTHARARHRVARAEVFLWLVAIGLLVVRALEVVRTHGRPVLRAAAATTAAAVRTAAAHSDRAARRGLVWWRATWRRQVAPNLLLGGALAALAARSGLRRMACWWERGERRGGIVADAVRARALDAVAMLAVVHGPAAWEWSRRHAQRTLRRGAVRATVTFRAARPHAPVVAHRLAVTVLVVTTVGIGGLFAVDATLQVAARAIDVHDTRGGMPQLEQTSTLLAVDGTQLADLHRQIRRRVVPLEEVPAHVRNAVIAAEDSRFARHGGYDLEAITRAALANLRAGRAAQGGSTITQQLAKQNYVGDERALRRKVVELLHAVALERTFTKDELLERYLNQVYFGAGAYGIAAAAEEFFATTPAGLTTEQAALLASLIRSPGAFDPRADLESTARRRNLVLNRMEQLGLLGTAEAATMRAAPAELAPPGSAVVREPFVVEAVKREFLANPAFGATVEERADLLYSGGLRITTTVDPGLQQAARDALAARLPNPDGATAALASVEVGTGRVRALASRTDFSESQFDLASQSRRQPGSLMKPFMAIAALEHGVDASTLLDGSARATYDLAGGPWTVSNFRGADHGRVDLREALVSSVNTAFADLVDDIGIDAVVDVTDRLGIDAERAYGPPSSRGPAIVLGGLTHGVSPLEMAAAYSPFLDDGRWAAPHVIAEVAASDGSILHRAQPSPQQALDPAATRIVADALEDAVSTGTGQAAQLPGQRVLGKTGTTTDGADAWFVGATHPLSTAVWVGYPDRRAAVAGSTGGSIAAPIWRDFTRRTLPTEVSSG